MDKIDSKIYGVLDSSEVEKKIIKKVNDHTIHLEFIVKQIGTLISKTKKLEDEIVFLKKEVAALRMKV